eukprot:606097_1
MDIRTSKADLIEFSQNHTFKVVVCYLMLSFLSNLGRYDFNCAISLTLFIFFDHILITHNLLVSLVFLVSCILDIAWISVEGAITHHYHHVSELRKLATFCFVTSIVNVVFKIMLIVCFAFNPNSERYKPYEISEQLNEDFHPTINELDLQEDVAELAIVETDERCSDSDVRLN